MPKKAHTEEQIVAVLRQVEVGARVDHVCLHTLTNSLTGQFSFGYDALSRRTQLTRPNGVNTNYSYDSVSHLLSVLHQAGSTTLDGASYGYDYAGNRTSKTNYLNGITSNYGYDAIYQLQQVTQGGSTTESYSYDAVGNRLSSSGVPTYSYNTSNELTSNSSGSYTYDNNGNTLTDASGKTYTWDFENRMISAIVPATGTVTFKYDPFGRRIQKSSSLGTTNYLYTGANLVDEVDQSGNLVTRYTLGDDVDEPFAVLRGGVTSYYQADGTWSVTSLSNTTGNLSKSYTHDAFGVVVNSTGTLTNSIQYTGRESDPETNLYFYRARYYDPTIGRFVQGDPIRWDGGPNFYSYVSNEPTLYRDPTGLLQLCCRPARSVTWTGAKACHCFLKLSDGTTLGGYFKPPPFLHKDINDPDDKYPKDKPECKDLPGSECKVRRAFNDLPTYLFYGIQGTSNAIPFRTLTAAGVPFTMPSCAWGASINPYPVITGPFVPTW